MTLDPDVAAKARKGAARLSKPFKEVVNHALRIGLDEVLAPSTRISGGPRLRPCQYPTLRGGQPLGTPIRAWWAAQLSGSEPVALCWPVLTAFLRIGTNPRILRRPLTLREASVRVQS